MVMTWGRFIALGFPHPNWVPAINQLEDDPAPGEDDFEDVGDGQAGRRCRGGCTRANKHFYPGPRVS